MKAYALSKTCAWMFIIANNWKQLWCPSTSASAQWNTTQQEESNGWISATCWAKEDRQSAVCCIFYLMNVQKRQIHSNSRFVVKAEVGGKWEMGLITGKLKGNSWEDGKDWIMMIVVQLYKRAKKKKKSIVHLKILPAYHSSFRKQYPPLE